MKRTQRSFLFLGIALLSSDLFCAIAYFSPRSQSVDSARELVGWTHQINLCCQENVYGSFSVTPEYSQSFDNRDITECLFSPDLSCVDGFPLLTVSGSQVADRGEQDWLADYFGLPTNFKSTITFSPQVDTFLVDIDFYLGLDEWVSGLYFRVHAPVVHTRWRLGMCETIIQSGTQNYPEGYFTPNETNRTNLLDTVEEFISQGRTPNLGPDVQFRSLQASKWSGRFCNRLTKTRLSDVIIALGWNFICNDYAHLGFNFRFSAPAGNRPKGEFLFEPMVGNGHHWTTGGGLTGHYTFWESCDGCRSVGLYADANVTHLFSARQKRSFDLCNGPNSRYMLAERLGTPVQNNLQGNGVTPEAQFKTVFTPVANLTTFDVDVSVGAQLDATALIDFRFSNVQFDIGYNVWLRSCESIDFRCDCPSPLQGGKTWALKGDAHVFGFDGTMPSDFVALSATQSEATIRSGRNLVEGVSNPKRNPNIDNPQPATGDSSGGMTNVLRINRLLGSPQINTSVEPVFLTEADIDRCAARTRGLSHSVFAHISYVWNRGCDCNDWIPYIGIGGKAQIASDNEKTVNSVKSNNPDDLLRCKGGCTSDCDSNCCSCTRCSLSEWAIWVKGGVSFN